ncbi:MAG: hypothetical protein WC292_04475 [Clostridia bacterium]
MAKLFSRKKKKNDDSPVLIKSQAARIEELKKEIFNVQNELSRLREREEGISDALRLAARHAKDYEREAKIRFALECERLDSYRRRWRGYISNLSRAEKLGQEVIHTEKLLKECREEMAQFIEEDLPSPPTEDYFSETERLKELEVLPAFGGGESLSTDELKKLILQLLEKEGN